MDPLRWGDAATGGVRLVVLPMSGTTVDDGRVVGRAYQRALEAVDLHPGNPQRDRALALAAASPGVRRTDLLATLLDDVRARVATIAFEAAYRTAVADGEVRARPGAGEAIEELREAGVAVCLTTTLPPPTRDALLEALAWTRLVDVALSPGRRLRPQPHPDLVLTAVLELGVDDVRAVAVAGDTAADLQAGHRAGATIVAGILGGAEDHVALAHGEPTHLLASVAELPAVIAEHR